MTGNAGGSFLQLKRWRKSGRRSEHNVLIRKGKAKPISIATKVRMKVATKMTMKIAEKCR
jgi:hypothetical protein